MTEIVILHDNDLHFNFHRIEEFTAAVNRIRKDNPNVFLMNAGDNFVRRRGRWPIDAKRYYAKRSRLIIETMNRVGYDVMTMGNHEMEHIGEHTKTALERARFPLLAANTEVVTDKLPPLKPYIIMETDNGRTLAVLGLTCGQYTTFFSRGGTRWYRIVIRGKKR